MKRTTQLDRTELAAALQAWQGGSPLLGRWAAKWARRNKLPWSTETYGAVVRQVRAAERKTANQRGSAP